MGRGKKEPRKKRVVGKKKKRANVHQMYIRDEVWDASGEVLEEIGLTRSRYCELILRLLVDSKSKTFAELHSGLFGEVMREAIRAGKIKKE